MDACEELAHLYFRLNGFFTVPNYILHGSRSQKGEIDLLAVRFPYKQEEVGGCPLHDDPALDLRADKLEMILAEVKRREEDFNESRELKWTMEYVLRFAGFFGDEECLAEASTRLAQAETYEDERVRIRRMLCTGAETITEDANRRKLQGMLDFIRGRFRKHRRHKADHEQWTGTLADYIYKNRAQIDFGNLEQRYLEYKRKRARV